MADHVERRSCRSIPQLTRVSRSSTSSQRNTMDLPVELRQALAAVATRQGGYEIVRTSHALSRRYRDATLAPEQSRLLGNDDVAAYVTSRMPATWAALSAGMSAARHRVPELSVRTQLDVGAGPGTATWAARAIWPELGHVTALERSRTMVRMGKELMRSMDLPPVVEWKEGDAASILPETTFDLVTAGYVLNEMPVTATPMIERLWNATGGLLLVVEPGTPDGFERIRQVRARLIELGARLAAPCPHERGCPMSGGNWCHFAQRVSRSSLHRRAKGGQLAYEDEKFSYVAATRFEVGPIAGRVLRHPSVRTCNIGLEVCAPQGLIQCTVSRRDGEEYRTARALKWGSAIEIAGGEP